MNKVSVKVVSIWSKIEGAEGLLMNRDSNFVYNVRVPACDDVNVVLGAAFSATNRDGRPFGNRCCSTSCGDVLIYNDRPYLVEGHGFHPLSWSEFAQVDKLTSRDTSFGYDFLVKHGYIKS